MAFKKDKLYQRVIDDLKRRSMFGIVFYPLVLIIVLLPSGYYGRHPEFSNQLTVLMLGICLFRLVHWKIARWLEPRFVKFNNGLFLFSVGLTALIWGIGFSQFMLQDGEFNTNLLMVMSTIGLSSGAVVAFYPDFRLAFVFSFFMLVPAIFVMISHGMNPPLIIAFVLMFLYLCFMAYRGNLEYWTALKNEYLLEEKSKAIEKISRIDSLTELYNRRYFDEVYSFEWNRAVRKKQSVSLVIADIDHFKKINDRCGHLAGDEYLKAAGILFRQVFKREIDIVARYGGEEFIVLMPGESEENAFQLAQSVRLKFEAYSLEFEGQAIQATISLGVATCMPDQNLKIQSLISRADEALYKSKVNGRNKVTAG